MEVEKLSLASQIEYQTAAVVSKSLLAKKTGNITLFAFDKGERLSAHTAPFDAFVHILDGKVEVTISGNEYELHSGEIIIMPANEPHALLAIEPFKMVLTMVKSE